jgi:hypothetical protein
MNGAEVIIDRGLAFALSRLERAIAHLSLAADTLDACVDVVDRVRRPLLAIQDERRARQSDGGTR